MAWHEWLFILGIVVVFVAVALWINRWSKY